MERQRARKMQNERDKQQVTAMTHREREQHISNELETEKTKRISVELKLSSEREKVAELEKEIQDMKDKAEKVITSNLIFSWLLSTFRLFLLAQGTTTKTFNYFTI